MKISSVNQKLAKSILSIQTYLDGNGRYLVGKLKEEAATKLTFAYYLPFNLFCGLASTVYVVSLFS
jgi:hypothetical protein